MVHNALFVAAFLGTLVLGQDVTTTPKPRHGYRTVCYVDGTATDRPSPVQFEPEDVDTRTLCNVLVFKAASVGALNVVPARAGDPDLYRRLIHLKTERQGLKVLLRISDTGNQFSDVTGSDASMHAFAANVIAYVHQYGFDGVDIDWEFPAAAQRDAFTMLMLTIRRDFNRDHSTTKRPRLMLTATVSADPTMVTENYNLPAVANQTDFINLMTYDMQAGDHKTGHHSALYSPTSDEKDSIDYAVNTVLKTGVDPRELNLGLSFYGRSYTLENAGQAGLGDAAASTGKPGPLTQHQGLLAYYEICQLLENNATVTDQGQLPGTKAPFVVDGERWTGYDDAESLKEKVNYMWTHNIGGVYIMSLDLDDFHGICGGGHYPLLNAVKQGIHEAIIGR